jgi:hypothetical protein
MRAIEVAGFLVVEALEDVNVIVDVDGGSLKIDISIPLGWKRLERRPVQSLKERKPILR